VASSSRPKQLSLRWARLAQQAKAYSATDPGGSYLGHQLMQAGRNVVGLPGQIGGGLADLASRLGIGAPQSAPY